MPPCGCTKPCNCAVAQNGAPIIVESSDLGSLQVVLFPTERVGWRDNVVSGTGSAQNPYMVSFKDSLEYRPKAQEWRLTPPADSDPIDWSTNPSVYSTPVPNATFIWASGSFSEEINLTATGLLVGAWASVNTGGVATPIELQLFYDFVVDDLGPDRIAGASTTTANPILGCTGYVTPLKSATSLFSSGLTASLSLQVRNPANVALTVSDVRLWAVEV